MEASQLDAGVEPLKGFVPLIP